MTETDILVIVWLAAMSIVAGTLLGVAVVAIFKMVKSLVRWLRHIRKVLDDRE